MNKTYRSVWNESSGTWVAAQETSKTRGKRGAAKNMLALVALGVGSHSGAAFAGGALVLCPSGGGTGWSHGYSGQATVNCSAATANGNYVQYNSYLGVGDRNGANGANGAGGSASVHDDYYTSALNLQRPGGVYLYNTTYLNNQKITSLAAGTVSSSSADAINGSQLYQVSSPVSSLLSQTTSQTGLLGASTPGGATQQPGVTSQSLLGVTSSLPPDQLLASGPTDKGGMIKAIGIDSMAIGLNTAAMADNALAIGDNVQVGSAESVGVGQNIAINGTNTVVIGTMASANASNAVVIGNNGTEANNDNAIAIGNNVSVGGNNTMAIGKDIVAVGVNSVTLGNASSDNGRANVLSVGSNTQQRQIINVGAGTQNTDAVNVSQLKGVTSALGGGATVNATTGAVVAPSYTVQSQTGISDVGTAIAKLDAAETATNGNVMNITNTVNNIVIGGGIKYFHANSTLADAVASGANAVAIGGNASATTANSVALGANSLANSTTLATAAFNPGNATLSAATAAGEVSVGAQAGERRITNLAAGLNATDAVNVSQLKSEDAKVNAEGTSIASVIGGGSTYDASTGKVTNPTYSIGGTTITTIGGALTNLDNRVYANSTDITNLQTQINDGGIGLVTQDPTSKNILVASKTVGSTVDFTGMAGARRLTGVAAGTVSKSSLDAVNGAQLFNVAASTASVIGGGSTFDPSTGRITNPTYNIGGTTITTIGGAITNLDNRVYANTTDITNLQTQINEGGIGIVTQDATSRNILVASKTDGTVVDFTNQDGAARVLTGVAAGTNDNDAVNVAQLKAAGIINGNGSTRTAVTYDTTTDASGKTVTNYSSITLGDGSAGAAPVAIHNVAAGASANDAVNYSQYADLVSKVNSISNAGTGVDTLFVGDGDRNTEAAHAGGTHSTAMGALSVANGLQSVAAGYASNATGSNAVAIGASSTASGNNSVALGAGSVATDDNTVSVGSASQQRRITNVASGTQGTDAVNVNQLNSAIASVSSNTVNQAVQQANSYTDQQFNKMNDKMNSLGAAAMAATSLIPNARAEGNFQMSAAAGTYGGASALAVGANYWVSDRLLVNAHVTRSTGSGASTGASVGASFGF